MSILLHRKAGHTMAELSPCPFYLTYCMCSVFTILFTIFLNLYGNKEINDICSFNSKCLFVIYILTYHFSSESLKTFGIRPLLVVK